jgi:hypothetical protein
MLDGWTKTFDMHCPGQEVVINVETGTATRKNLF